MVMAAFTGELPPIGAPPSLPAVPLLLLIGLPGSGKSHLAETLMQQDERFCLVSTDRIRGRLFGDEAFQGPWQRVWHDVGKQFQQSVQQILAQECSQAIYDATNVVRRQRRQAIALARSTGFTEITGIWIDTPLSVCLQRNQLRDRTVPEAVLLRMHCRLIGAAPAVEDGFDRLVRLVS